MDDAELVSQALQGNSGAYGRLVERYAAQIAALCRALVGRQPEVVEDLVQETFLRGLQKLSELREPARFGYWLNQIARNLCKDWFTNPHRRQLPLEAAAPPVCPANAATAAELERAERFADLKACVDHLPVERREVVELYYSGGGFKYAELAELLGVAFGTVNAWLTKARKQLRDCLEKKQGEITSRPAAEAPPGNPAEPAGTP